MQSKSPSKRPGVEALLNKVEELAEQVVDRGESVVLLAELPTGYGKSTASMLMLSRLNRGRLGEYAERVIHVVPTRCLVEDLVERARKRGIKAYGQCMYLDPSMKAPFFLPRLVFSTADSYALNFYKLPVEEVKLVASGASRGHYDVPRYAISTAVNVFDEYHLLTPGDEPPDLGAARYSSRALTTLVHTVRVLVHDYKCPVVLETATPRRELDDLLAREGIKVRRLVYTVSSAASSRGEAILVRDEEFESKLKEVRYATKVVKRSFVESLYELVSRAPKPLLVACNTIREAVDAFQVIKEVHEGSMVLLHSQLTLRDREERVREAKESISRGGDVVVVATQVVEVGVDLDFNAMITNAAPLTPLVQRAGRVGRNLDRVVREGVAPEVVVVYDDSRAQVDAGSYSGVYSLELTLKTVERLVEVAERGLEVGWRLTTIESRVQLGGREVVPVSALSATVYETAKMEIDLDLEGLLSSLLSPFVETKHVLTLLESLGSFLRDDFVVPVLVQEVEPGSLDHVDPGAIVPCRASKVGVYWSRRGPRLDRERAGRVLELRDGKVLAVLEVEDELLVEPLEPSSVVKGVLTGVVWLGGRPAMLQALVAKREVYDPEVGLAV